MELTDIAPLEVWKKLEDEICKRSGLNASVFDMKGIRITGSENWVNELCPKIKAHTKGQTFICSLAHQNIVAQVEKGMKAVIDECDAGMVKVAVPIVVEGKMHGVVGGCGLMLEGGEVDTFLIQRTIGGEE
jgi:ligand-binding sensor protein